MRILFLTHRLPYAPNRGDRLRAYWELRELSRHHEVTLVALVHDAEEMGHLGDVEGVASKTVGARVPRLRNKLRAARFLATERPLTHALLDSPAVQPAVARIVADSRPDVVLAYCSSMARYALQPPLNCVPLVIDMVDADSAKWTALSQTSRPPLRWIYRREARTLARFEAAAMRRAHVTVVVNEREREVLKRLAPDCRVDVVRVGIDVKHLTPPGDPSSRPTVVFCGVMDYAPNEAGALWLVRDVWPVVRQHVPSASLFVVGARPTRAVKALESREHDVHVTGTVDDVRSYLWSAAVAAAPLKTARGVQNKVLEAVAAGLPTVVTRAVWEGLPDEVRPACDLADDSAEFARALVALLRLPPAGRRARANSARLASLAWEPQIAVLERLLIEAASAGAPQR